jgi:regulator of protease activity HflC (stomatin/prohibitin superfamily)
MVTSLIIIILSVLGVLFIIQRTAIIIPQQSAYVIERLGKYSRTLEAGFHILLPFIDTVRIRLSLKEIVLDTPEQQCITNDNVQLYADGIVYFRIIDPHLIAYGVDDYIYALTQLCQTSLRSEIGKIALDKTFEVRDQLNDAVVRHLEGAVEAWGLKILRYEIQSIRPSAEVLAAMEEQAKAERKKRAAILASEGEKQAHINQAEGEKYRIISASEAARERQINEARGQAEAILALSQASAEGLRAVAQSAQEPGGAEAMQLRVAEKFITEFGKIAKEGTTIVVPANLADVSSMISLASEMLNRGRKGSLKVVGDG